MALTPPQAAFLTGAAALLGQRHVLRGQTRIAPYLEEPRGKFKGAALAVLRPGSSTEVSAVAALCRAHRIGVVPQGGGTGLVGGQISQAGQVVLSLKRMNRIIHADAGTVTVEAGATLQAIKDAADEAGLLFPLMLASGGSATIGGALATNAGGTSVLRYGSARALCLDLEAVLADGSVIGGVSPLLKDNTGYALRDLMIGSEGTLGIITRAALRLFPQPKNTATALMGLKAPDAALSLLKRMRAELGDAITSFELMPRFGIELACRHIPGCRDPLSDTHEWYVLIEANVDNQTMETALGAAFEIGLLDNAALAASHSQQRDFWRVREGMSEAQRHEGGSIKHDISVPVAAIPELIRRATPAVKKLCPGVRPVPFGHLGDGNLHYNFTQPEGMERESFLALWEPINASVHDIVHELGGSI